MLRSLYSGITGLGVSGMSMSVLGDNLANSQTTGFKRATPIFQELMGQAIAARTAGNQVGLGATTGAIWRDFSQGALRETGNPLDVAINGRGFFSVQTPDGVQYTRQGSFSLNDEGVLVTPDGYPIVGEGGEITLEAGVVEIDDEGGVFVDGEEVDRLVITDFADQGVLKKAGQGRFVLDDATAVGDRPPHTTLRQGYVETANVNAVAAMTEMIETSRAFEAYQKIIQSVDEATETSINDIGQTV